MRTRGFTLIEIMICIAIIAIVTGTASVAWLGLAQLRREGDFRIALQSARHQLAELRTAPFSSLPPEILTVGPSGELHLGQSDLVPGTLRLTRLDSAGGSLTPERVEASTVRLARSLAGCRVMANYEWYLPGRNEVQLVLEQGRVPLWNAPAVRVDQVRTARGASLTKLEGWRLSPDRCYLEVPPALAGRAVVIDYLGSRVRNRARGRFLDEGLQPLDGPSPLKLMEVLEDYGGQVGTLRLTALKVNR